MRISINEILVILAVVLVVMIIRNPDSIRHNPISMALAAAVRAGKKDAQARALAADEQRRRNTPCRFRDGFSQSQFAWMVQRAGRYLPWVARLEVSGTMVSGILTADDDSTGEEFTLDFNDYGHVTGKYWVSKSGTSNLPERFAVCIIRELDEWKSGAGRAAYEQERRCRRRTLLRRAIPLAVVSILLLALLIRSIF